MGLAPGMYRNIQKLISLELIVYIYCTSENIFGITHKLEKYMKDHHFYYRYLLHIACVGEISLKGSGGFGQCRHEWV